MSITELPRRAPRPLPPMPFEPRNYRRHTEACEPEPEPVNWWDRTIDRLIDWITPGRFWSIYACLILAALLGAWLIH